MVRKIDLATSPVFFSRCELYDFYARHFEVAVDGAIGNREEGTPMIRMSGLEVGRILVRC